MDYCGLDNLEDSEQSLSQIVCCFTEASNLSAIEKSTLYYICDHVTYKEGLVCLDQSETVPLPEKVEFTLKVSRRKLRLPPLILYNSSQYSLREKNPYSEFFWSVFSSIRARKTPNMETFHSVTVMLSLKNGKKNAVQRFIFRRSPQYMSIGGITSKV